MHHHTNSIGMGLHHSGVEILGREYSFASGGGIFDSSPRDAPGAQFRESIELGAFDGGSSELNSAISGKLLGSLGGYISSSILHQ